MTTQLKKVQNRYFIKNKTKYSPLDPVDIEMLEALDFRFVTK
jgi:hypothetical protein